MRRVILFFLASCISGASCTEQVQPPSHRPSSQPASQPTTAPSSQPARPLNETEKIEALIASVARLQNAVFIRNDEEYDCQAAAKHMRDKWQWKRKEIKSAGDFIRIAANKSSTSGKAYIIRFKDGREIPSGKYLAALLQQMASDSTSSTQPAKQP